MQILVRDGKGGVRMLPQSVVEPLREHLVKVWVLHRQDIADGIGGGLSALRTGSQISERRMGVGVAACFPPPSGRSIHTPAWCGAITRMKKYSNAR